MHTWHMTWEQWHIYYSEHNNLFTMYMYINLRDYEVLANNWSKLEKVDLDEFNL